MSTLADYLGAGGDPKSLDYYRLLEEVTPDQWPALVRLTADPSPDVRRAAVATLPLLDVETPRPEWVDLAIGLTTDPDRGVRDHACFVLARQWREVDTEAVRNTLAARLDDLDRDVRCEALVGLAFRRDPRALPRVRAALSRPGEDVWRLEMVAAGALGDPSLHPLVARHLDGWDDEQTLTVEAARRLTRPGGPGADLFRQVAGLYAARSVDEPDDPADLAAWQLMSEMLGIAPHLAPSFFTRTAARLAGDPAALAYFTSQSALATMLGLID